MSENEIVLNIITLSALKGFSNIEIARILKQDITIINNIVGIKPKPSFYLSTPYEGITTICEFEDK